MQIVSIKYRALCRRNGFSSVGIQKSPGAQCIIPLFLKKGPKRNVHIRMGVLIELHNQCGMHRKYVSLVAVAFIFTNCIPTTGTDG